MKAIVTKYHGPTNHKGSRITASDEDGNRVTISYPHELSGEDVHRTAAQALCDKMGWTGSLTGGSLKKGYVFVFTDRDPFSCELCGLTTVDVHKRENGYKLCDLCLIVPNHELLTALRGLTKWATGGDKHKNPYCYDAVKQALVAIAKARGIRVKNGETPYEANND